MKQGVLERLADVDLADRSIVPPWYSSGLTSFDITILTSHLSIYLAHLLSPLFSRTAYLRDVVLSHFPLDKIWVPLARASLVISRQTACATPSSHLSCSLLFLSLDKND